MVYILSILSIAMHSGHKHRKQKEVMGKSQTYATGIKVLFMHPSSLYYVAVCKENNLKILDLPTMSFIG